MVGAIIARRSQYDMCIFDSVKTLHLMKNYENRYYIKSIKMVIKWDMGIMIGKKCC